jgi:uncharacterized protein
VQTVQDPTPKRGRDWPRTIDDVIPDTSFVSRRRLWAEIGIVLGLSLGASALYSIVSILNSVTRTASIASQTATLNRSLSDRQWFDLVYQLMSVFFDLMPVALVGYLLWSTTRPHLGRLGIDFTRAGRQTLGGVALAAAIGIPGLGFYLLSRMIGINLNVVPVALDTYWWTVPVLILSALRAGITEEVIVIGYLYARLRDLGWGKWRIIVASALLRGTYHLYQGLGSFIANIAMGVLFGWLYTRYGRVLPLVIAHAIIDTAVFVGYAWAAATFPAVFGPLDK